MSSALKWRGQKSLNYFIGQTLTNHSRTYGKHVGVIMGADHARGIGIRTDAAPYALDLIGGHHNALTSATQDNAKPAITRGNMPGCRLAMDGVISTFSGCGPNIDGVPAECLNVSGKGLAQRNGRVITGQDNSSVGVHALNQARQ